MIKGMKGKSMILPYSIYWHDTNMNGELSFAALSRYLQETAWVNAESLGFGYTKASELKQAWVLVRQLIKMKRMPKWGEKINIETWPRKKEGLLALRDYQVHSLEGEILGGVSSSWMIIDIDSRRPLKLDIFIDNELKLIEKQALDESAGKIVFKEMGKKIDSRTVRYSDMDFNGHVNNSKFVEWAMDALSLAGIQTKYHNLQINFHTEVMLQDSIEIFMIDKDHRVLLKAINRIGKIIFVMELF
jgi:acyl-ACP thioesterase